MDSLARYLSIVRSACAHWASVAAASVLMVLCGYLYAFAPPADFTPGTIVRVARGSALPEIAQELADARVIMHPALLRAVLRLSGTSGTVQTGAYKFAVPESMLVIAYRLVAGDYGLPPIRITFFEGMTIREMADRVANASPDISAEDVLTAAKGQEGYLFPDTYFFEPSADAASIVETLRANFNVKIREVDLNGRSISDVVTMASLVEREARTDVDRRLVAGILWNRIRLGMPLQVDAVFGYIFNRDTYSPSPADLKADSPYNTYTHQGLPPGPIANPGLDALLAAANPAKTNYLYYLTGHDGLMHYATTYPGHQANLRKYLY